MWLYCRSGFFSAVEHLENPNVIHVRARFKGDLERLCKEHGVEPIVLVTPGNDYRYRMDFDHTKWAEIVKEEAMAIDYTNFKAAVHDGTERDSAYMGAWSAMRRKGVVDYNVIHDSVPSRVSLKNPIPTCSI